MESLAWNCLEFRMFVNNSQFMFSMSKLTFFAIFALTRFHIALANFWFVSLGVEFRPIKWSWCGHWPSAIALHEFNHFSLKRFFVRNIHFINRCLINLDHLPLHFHREYPAIRNWWSHVSRKFQNRAYLVAPKPILLPRHNFLWSHWTQIDVWQHQYLPSVLSTVLKLNLSPNNFQNQSENLISEPVPVPKKFDFDENEKLTG